MMSHDELRGLLGVFALDAIDDPDELAEVEAHLALCEECRSEVDAHRSVTAAMADADLSAPSSLWGHIESELDTKATIHVTRRWPVHGLTTIAAAVAVVAAVGMTTLWADANGEVEELRNRVGELVANVEEAEAALERDPIDLAVERARASDQAFEVTVGGVIGSSQAIVLPDGYAWLTNVSFEPLDDTQTYQLWAIQDGAVISAGILGPVPGTVAFHVDADRLDGLVITVETAGGVVSSSNGAAAAWLAET